MPQNGIECVESAASHLAAWIAEHDYSIDNEAELCALAHQFILNEFLKRKFPLSGVKLELKLMTTNSVGRGTVKASIDFGLRFPGRDGEVTRGHLEAKAWIRPDYKGSTATNSSSTKRRQCISDGKRLLEYAEILGSAFSGLLIFERGSTHLRRLVESEILAENILPTSRWLDIQRPSLGRKAEHLGIIWLAPRATA